MSSPESLAQDIEALQSLVRHPGWQFMIKQISNRKEFAMNSMRNAPTQDQLLKHTYTYMALADLAEAPDMLIKTFTQQLQALKKA